MAVMAVMAGGEAVDNAAVDIGRGAMARSAGARSIGAARREAREDRRGAAGVFFVGLGRLAVLAWVGAATAVSAHTAGVPIPPEGDFIIRWHQPHSVRPVDDWEIEVTPELNPAGRFITRTRVVPEASCWALSVPVTESSIVRIRSVVGNQVSSWTRPTIVPEPGLAAGVASACGALVLLARRSRRRRSRTRSA